MSDGPDNLILRYLREIDRKLDVVIERVDNLTVRVSALEAALGLLASHSLNQFAAINARLDSFDRRLERIERRLNLVEAS